MKKQAIIRGGFFSVIQTLSASLIYLGAYFSIIFFLGKAQLGVWSIITAFPAAIAIFGSGVSGALVRFLPVHLVKSNRLEIHRLLFNGFLFNVVVGGCLSFAALIWAKEILMFIFNTRSLPSSYLILFDVSICTFLINFLASVFLSGLEALGFIPLKNKILIAASTLFLVIAIVLMIKVGIMGLLIAQLLQAIFIMLLSLYFLRVEHFFGFSFSLLDKKTLWKFCHYGGGLQLISMMTILFEPTTKFFINRYFGLDVVGLYDMVSRVATQLRTILVNGLQAIVPFVAAQGAKIAAVSIEVYRASVRLTTLISFIVFGLLGTAGFALQFVLKADVVSLQIMMLYLCIANVANICSAPAYAVLLGSGKLRPILISHVIATCLNAGFYILWTQHHLMYWILLPPTIASLFAAIFIIRRFLYTNHLRAESYSLNEKLLLGFSIVLPLTCGAISYFCKNMPVLLVILALHSLLVIGLSARNMRLRSLFVHLIKMTRE